MVSLKWIAGVAIILKSLPKHNIAGCLDWFTKFQCMMKDYATFFS